jgi:translation initiation factor 4E
MKDQDGKDSGKVDSPRSYTSRRFGDSSSHGKSNPFNALSPSTTKSPSAGASSAFGLGSGAFASFGSAKTPKTPGGGSGFDFPSREKSEKKEKDSDTPAENSETEPSQESSPPSKTSSDHPLRNTWNLFYRPPANKFSDYEKSTLKLASISSVESFWTIYSHLKRPSLLPTVSDYHIFKDGIRPVWEDEANKKGGKWIVRLKKGVADRYWEDLLLAIIGDQFMEAGEEVCGAVLSVRSGEDVLSVWTKIDGGRNIKIRYGKTFNMGLSSMALTTTIGKPSRGRWAFLPTRILYGRATMTVSRNDQLSTRPDSKNRVPPQATLDLRDDARLCATTRTRAGKRERHDIHGRRNYDPLV